MSARSASASAVGDRALESVDRNLEISGLLHDLSHIHADEPRRIAYRRAAAVVAGMDRPITDLVRDGRLEKLPRIGPSIERVILEYLDSGESRIVQRALAAAGTERQRSIEKRRLLRGHFLSVARAREILLSPAPPGVVGMGDYLGDLQQHSTWSDGTESIAEIVGGSIELRQRYAALTDHYGLAVANGMTADDFAHQHEAIDVANDHYAALFRLLKGVEANIQADGTLDVPGELVRSMDIVVASPHSLLRRADDQTARMVNAVLQPGVHILGHPRGRRFNDRAGVIADWDRVFAAAAGRGVAIEIDGTWERQDVDYDLAGRALRHGCLFALDSDAHNRRERHFSAIAVAHARLAGIPADRVVNCWPLERLLEWSRGSRH